MIDLAARQVLGRHVCKRSDDRLFVGEGEGRVGHRREPEVDDLRLPRRVDDDVRRLDVAVDQSCFVCRGQPVADPFEQLQSAREAERQTILDQRREGEPLDVLHRHVRSTAIVVDVEDGDDVGMMQSTRRAGFLFEACAVCRRIDSVAKDLQRNQSADRGITGEIHHAHSALAEAANDLVRSDSTGETHVGNVRIVAAIAELEAGMIAGLSKKMEHSSRLSAKELFEQAADLDPAGRTVLLAEACAGDDALRAVVARLLEAHDQLGTFLDVSPVWNAGEPDPQRVGHYEIVRKLGEGGTGWVYLAEPGPVAVKIVRQDVEPAVVMRRFERERQMLARLEHPGIARLLDGGLTPTGSPYLVLTFVDGTPLDEFCRDRYLGLRGRLELFRDVCRAVSFAHGRLVIHRDLKPANILVNGHGAPVVLDFGLAKLTETTLATALDSTTTGHRLLTPDYASPEQVTGLPATPAVDVYALGVILYELLTGVRPHKFTTWSLAEIIEVICRGVVAPPGAVLRSARRPDCGPVLDAIVMKALAKAPARRYGHVAELEDDILRYLAGRSVPTVEPGAYQPESGYPPVER